MNKITPPMPIAEKIAAFMQVLEDGGAIAPEIVEMEGENAFADALIIVGARSRRHALGLADAVTRLCQEKNIAFAGMEGQEAAQWLLIDCNDLIINIFQEDTRNLYKLEELWAKKARIPKKEIIS